MARPPVNMRLRVDVVDDLVRLAGDDRRTIDELVRDVLQEFVERERALCEPEPLSRQDAHRAGREKLRAAQKAKRRAAMEAWRARKEREQ